jgi:hypothetical protein
MTEQQAGAAKPPYPQEPNVHSGGVQDPGGDRDLPPYEDRQTAGVGTDTEKLEEERGGLPGHDAGPRQVSDAERGGMTDTDTSPSGPLSGVSTSTSGEDIAPGSESARRSERLEGGLSQEEATGPATHTGDQGG